MGVCVEQSCALVGVGVGVKPSDSVRVGRVNVHWAVVAFHHYKKFSWRTVGVLPRGSNEDNCTISKNVSSMTCYLMDM